MTDREALLRAVAGDPDDDELRLVCADWLEENGEPERAEFIRVQLEAARLRPPPARRLELNTRAANLWDEHAGDWLLEVPAPVRKGCAMFRRGFAHRFDCTARQFLKASADIVARVPLQELCLVKSVGLLGAVADCPALAGVIRLEMVRERVGAELGALASSPHLGRLRRLWLHSCRVGPDGARALASSPLWPRLEELTLTDNPLGDSGAAALAGAAPPPGLTHLNLQSCGVGDEGVGALAGSPILTSVTDLNLLWCLFGEAGARALAQSPFLQRLQDLRCASFLARTAAGRVLRARFGDRVGFY
jgi:uncharacterized protein (TIGR02996 family)